MTTLTATPDTANGRVRLVYSDAAGGTMTRTRADTGETETVRGGDPVVGTHGILDDYEAPFEVDLTYTLEDGSDTVTFTPDDTAWLSHPFDPSLTLPVVVEDDDPWTWSVSGGVLDVIDSPWPVALHSRRTVHTGSLSIVGKWADRDKVKALVIDGSPMLLRSTPTCKVDDQWVFAQDITREKMGGPFGERLRWRMDYQRVGRPEGEIVAPPANAWSAVTQTHPTWTDTVAGHVTWSDLVTTPHPHA